MNVVSVVGGGCLILAIAYFLTVVIFSQYWIPPGGRLALTLMAVLSAVSVGGVGLSLLFGVDVLWLDVGQWAGVFVIGQAVFLWAFDIALTREIFRRRREDD